MQRTVLLTLALAAGAASGAITNIAQVPLLNITGTGTVKPNLMVLYDNSGSMAQTYTPDYVNDALCRSAATLSGGTRSCAPGDPPFMSADFNRQYYSPRITYTPPVRADGSSYASMTRAATATWSSVSGDGFGVNTTGLNMSSSGTINLTNGFPDLKWCNGGACVFNSATYSYPDNTYRTATAFTTNPYYYTILPAEYCTDTKLTTCQTVTPGAAAPAGYPVPAKVRWCNSTSLSTCQAKYRSPGYVYPRYSSPASAATGSYGVITIGTTASSKPSTIVSVSVAESDGPVVITNAAVAASTGTNTATKQAAVAEALAAAIVAKTGLTRQYTACVKSPSGGVVPSCSSWGIALSSTNLVAVIPIDCTPGATSKTLGQCSVVPDDSRNGWGVSAVVSAPATAFISVSGSTSSSSAPVLASGTKLGATTIMSSSLTLSKSQSASSVASAIATKIGTGGAIAAYAAPNTITNACAGKPAGVVCLVDSSGATGLAVTMAALSNNVGAGGSASQGSIVFTTTASSNAGEDAVPVSATPLSAGAAIFVRTDIVPSQTTYPKDINRSDCVTLANNCTYDEEMTNFANWYVYYKTRNQMMKSALGRAFQPLNGNYRVGFVSLTTASVNGTFQQLPQDFTGTARATWYTTLYGMSASGGTPMRPALHNVGRMYANVGNNVVQFPCQQNFVFITTDGYWNGSAASTVTNNDNVESAARFCSRIKGCLDTRSQNPQSLADIALYWYNGGANSGLATLNAGIDDLSKAGQVPAAADENTHLHMNTYALGLGMVGLMDFDPNYDSSPTVGGDFYKLITGAGGCSWNNNGTYVWPDPQTGSTSSTVQERVDDLWHSAINGHGKYFSAADPEEVVSGLNAALTNIQVRIGAAAAAATSTPNISQQDNDIFSDTFTTVKWYGELTDRKIDTVTGIVSSTPQWSTTTTLGTKVGSASDTRILKMLDTSGGSAALKDFKYSALSAQEKAWFDSKCISLPQCSSLSAADKALVNDGNNVVNWLRGQQQYANDSIFRTYAQTTTSPPVPIVLGDIASAKPAYLREPRKGYTMAGYADFKATWAGRQATVFAAANDGMLHAFKAGASDQGEEMWAYVPRVTMSKLYAQTSTTYGTNHQFTVDGSPELADVQIGGVWKTVLVAGFNAGGRGYYALDVTDPANPRALWEVCADSAVCAISDGDFGLTVGNPQFGMWNNQWVVFVTSGYNNVPGTDGVAAGGGGGFLYALNVATGAIVDKIATGSGDAGTPSGLAKITAITANPDADPVVTHVYGGDTRGQMWRFDLSNPPHGVTPTLLSAPGASQPITTRPDVTLCEVITKDASGAVLSKTAEKFVLFGTGRLLDLPDVTDTSLQSAYLVRDSASTVAARGASMVRQTLSAASGGYGITSNTVDFTLQPGHASTDGWYVDFDQNSGERVNLDPKIVSGAANIVTNIPSASSSCSVGGTSNAYSLNVCTGSYVSPGALAGTVLSNNSAAVGFIIVRLPSGALKMVTTTADGSTITTGVAAANSQGARKGGWRRVRE